MYKSASDHKRVNQIHHLRFEVAGQWLKRFITAAYTIVFVLSNFTPVFSQESIDTWRLLSQIGGSTQAIAVVGKMAYAGIGMRITSINFTNPGSPEVLGSSEPFGDFVQDIMLYGWKTFVAAGRAGIGIVDLTDPTQPLVLGTWDSPGFAEGIAVKENFAYLADGPDGVRVLDVSNAANPIEIGSAYSDYYALDVLVSGNYAYIAAGESGLLVVDISNPSTPVELSQLNTPGYAYAISISGRYIYIADAWEGVAVIDVSDPELPVLAGSAMTNGWALSIAGTANTLYTGNGGNGVQSFDISIPTEPKAQGSYLGNGAARRIVVSGTMVYVADTLKGVRIIDASDSTNLTQVGMYNQLPYARRVTLDGEYAYVASGADGGMYVINVADPSHPYRVSMFQADGNAAHVAIRGEFAYLATFMASTNYLTVIDITNPEKPVKTSEIPLGSLTPTNAAARHIAIQGDLIHVADEFGIRIFDVSIPGLINQVGQIQLDDTGDQTIEVAIAGDYAYVSDGRSGLRIVNAIDPANPTLSPDYLTSGNNSSVTIQDKTIYMGNYAEGVEIATFNKPGDLPTRLGTHKSLGQVDGISISGTELFASEGITGIEVFDVSNPARINQIELLTTPGYAWSTAPSGKFLFVADGNGGLLIFEKGGGGVSTADSPKMPDAQSSTETGMAREQLIIPESQFPIFPENIQRVSKSGTCVVSNTADSGSGSFRACLEEATNGYLITFDTSSFPPDKPSTILLASPLPILDDGSVTIDASNAGVILDGTQTIQFGLSVSSSYNTIMGIEFWNFTGDGIVVEFPSQYNQIGGDHFIGDGESGQGNVFNGNAVAIRVLYASHNMIKGNFIGTNASGTIPGKMNPQGIVIGDWGTYNQIGGTTEGERNIVSGNGRGVNIASNTAAWNVVIGNYIGTDITGTKAIPNNPWGVMIEVGARNNVVGGLTSGERNVISGNNGWGIGISDDETTQNSVIGNYIGVDASGTVALPNKTGISIFQAMYNRVGGTQPGEANLISGNIERGISIYGMGPINAVVMGNNLGLDMQGNPSLPNGAAIWIYGGSHSFIGGLQPGSGNLISGNRTGVDLDSASSNYNWIAGNIITNCSEFGIRIHNSSSHNIIVRNTISLSELGISITQGISNLLRANSISDNSLGIQLSEGGNQSLIGPVLTQVTGESVSGTTCPYCRVEVFSDPKKQGLTYEGSTLADGTGSFIFSKEFTGPMITAIATDSNGNSSSFSIPAAIQ